jgi:hypothetical protein
MEDTTSEKKTRGMGKIYSRVARGGDAVWGQLTYRLWAVPVLRWSDSAT